MCLKEVGIKAIKTVNLKTIFLYKKYITRYTPFSFNSLVYLILFFKDE